MEVVVGRRLLEALAEVEAAQNPVAWEVGEVVRHCWAWVEAEVSHCLALVEVEEST
jgi:hypothetical protein